MKKVRINENRIELLKIILCFKFIPIDGLAEVSKAKGIYNYKQNLRTAIRTLERAGYIKSYPCCNHSKCICLTEKGKRLLLNRTDTKYEVIKVGRLSLKPQFATIYRTKELCDLYTALLEKFSINDSTKIQTWIGSQNLHYNYSFRNVRWGRNIRRVLQPDVYCEIKIKDKLKSFFIDYSNCDIPRDNLCKIILRYFEYFSYGDWRDKFKNFPEIIFILDKKQEVIDRWFAPEEIELERALRNRNLFFRSKNIIWKSIGLSDNVRSMYAMEIRDFLRHKMLFLRYGNYSTELIQ